MDNKYNYLINKLSSNFVWETTKYKTQKRASLVDEILNESVNRKRSKVYGIGLAGKYERPLLEFYVDPKQDLEYLNHIIKNSNYQFRYKLLECTGFRPRQSPSIQPILRTGDQVGHFALGGHGSLGGFVDDLKSNYRLAISNNHVFADCNKATINDALMEHNNNTRFGGLHRFIPLLPPPHMNVVDVAAGWIYDNYNYRWRGRRPIGTTDPIRGMEVYKYGATSGYTRGTIVAEAATAAIPYQGLGNLNFRSIVRIIGKNGQPFSQAGDSGSFVFSMNGYLVGIIFAGASDESDSLACNFSYVEDLLEVLVI